MTPPGGGFGGPPGGGAMGAFGGAMGTPGAPGMPSIRNPLMTMLIPGGIIGGGIILAIILGLISATLSSLVMLLAFLAGGGLGFYSTYKMLTELHGVTKDPEFNWWYILIPYFGTYFALIKVPEQVTKAKQMVRAQNPTRGLVVYLFLYPYALAADLNDIAKPNG
jgi:hypothetical protein